MTTDAQFEPCDTSLVPVGEVATEVLRSGEVALYVYGDGFRIRLTGERFATLRSVCHAVDVLYAQEGLS